LQTDWPVPETLADVIDGFQAGGRYTFSDAVLARHTGGSELARKAACSV
jgi:hypothetical protein